MTVDACSSCNEPLIIEIEADSDYEDEETSVQDDVELNCGCHFHWECFMEAYSITSCPKCDKDISSLSATGQQQVLCTIRNEGGTQVGFDILPSATEEAYLRTYPEERIGHAYLEFCREGDVDAIVHLYRDSEQNDVEEQDEKFDILKYQGTFEGIEGSGLHIAIRYNQVEVAWLLLVLSSSLDWSTLPEAVRKGMKRLGIEKKDRRTSPDIRALEDTEGRTAAAVAKEIGGSWLDWVKDGRLAP